MILPFVVGPALFGLARGLLVRASEDQHTWLQEIPNLLQNVTKVKRYLRSVPEVIVQGIRLVRVL